MIRISNISFFRFCWKNEKLDWPKCARTEIEFQADVMGEFESTGNSVSYGGIGV